MNSFWSRTFEHHRAGRDTRYVKVTGFWSPTVALFGVRFDRHRFEAELHLHVGPVLLEVWWTRDGR